MGCICILKGSNQVHFALCSLGGEVEGKEKEDESYYRYKEFIKNLIRLTLLLR